MRALGWDGCVNVRDLGGLPTADGRQTRIGLIVRADDIGALSPVGWQALRDYGVRTAVDLRFPQERSPRPDYATGIGIREIPLFGRIDRAASARIDALVLAAQDAAEALQVLYVDALETHATRIAEATGAVAAGLDDGAVLVHCAIGKDRTGIVSALVLRLAGVSVDDVADDYALSHDNVAPLVSEWIAEAADPDQELFRSRMCAAPRAGMRGMLEVLEERYGGAEAYLVEAGTDRSAIEGIRRRLRAEHEG